MIDARAAVDPGARLAADVTVGAFAVIGAQVEVGAGTVIGPHAVIQGPTRIGRDNRIFQFASIGGIPQDMKFHGEPTWLEIGDRNTFFEFVTINRGTAQDRGKTTIGNDNWIMAYVHVAHDCELGNHIIMANNATLAGHVSIEDWAVLGGFTKVHQFCRIGTHSFTGMNVDLSRDVPPYMMISGTPAEPRGINSEGLRRRGFNAAQVRNIKSAYRVLYRSDLRLQEALAKLRVLSATQSELQCLVEFLETSERSITR
ncbi:MAG: acyl-ACP--UDP-N-acetylglucosamine O-acyltransferase [Gammaproteobacteria bacterium]|nr:acyl-ACP--UDP-N-acetylglucosamine O-acyltransferase [Gammaproteobacteria bacterium]MDE2023222.1 acyl-ACP--UDP-N-acetylglucosamine O-acyltransferase [Gammaproteobacteria bacterium]